MIIAISGLTIEEKRHLRLDAGWKNILTRRRGSAGAGKDEAAKQLVAKHNFVPVAFADPMKRFAAELFDWDQDRLWGPSENRAKEDQRYPRTMGPFGPRSDPYLTARHVLQSLGNDWGREMCTLDVWVLYAMRVAEQIGSGEYVYDQTLGLSDSRMVVGPPRKNVVFTDLRYKNEAAAVRKGGGYLVRVRRWVPEIKVSPTHQSEIDLLDLHDDDFDWVLHNRSTLEDLWNQVDHMVANIGK